MRAKKFIYRLLVSPLDNDEEVLAGVPLAHDGGVGGEGGGDQRVGHRHPLPGLEAAEDGDAPQQSLVPLPLPHGRAHQDPSVGVSGEQELVT